MEKLYEVKLSYTYVIAISEPEPNVPGMARYYLRSNHDLSTEVAKCATLEVAPITDISQIPEHYKGAIPYGGPDNMPVEQYFPDHVKQLKISKLQKKLEEIKQELETLKSSDV